MAWHPTLDDMERRPDRPWDRPRSRDNRDPETVLKIAQMGSGDCWCGNAEWAEAWHAGRIRGPHPRPAKTVPRQ